MCRMLALHASGPGLDVASSLVKLLYRASASDPYLEALAGDGRHCDGYGYVAVLRLGGGGWAIAYERFDARPVLSGEEACVENLRMLGNASKRLSELIKSTDEALVILHSRRASSGPHGVLAAHPFREEIILDVDGGSLRGEAYLAHNGSVVKGEIASAIGLRGLEDAYTDSHLALKYIVNRLKHARLEAIPGELARGIYKELEGYVKPKSALNVALMIIAKDTDPLLMAYGYVGAEEDKARWSYYKPIVVWSQGISAFISSTIWDLAVGEGMGFEDNRVIHRKLAILHHNKPPEII